MAQLPVDVSDNFDHHPPGDDNAERIQTILGHVREIVGLGVHNTGSARAIIRSHAEQKHARMLQASMAAPGGYMSVLHTFDQGFDHLNALCNEVVTRFKENFTADSKFRYVLAPVMEIGNVMDSEERVIFIPFVKAMRLEGDPIGKFMEECVSRANDKSFKGPQFENCMKNSFVVYPPHKAWYARRHDIVSSMIRRDNGVTTGKIREELIDKRRRFFRNARSMILGGYMTSLGCFYEPNNHMHLIKDTNNSEFRGYMKATNNLLRTKEAINILANFLSGENPLGNEHEEKWRLIITVMLVVIKEISEKSLLFQDVFSYKFSASLRQTFPDAIKTDFVDNLSMWTFPDLHPDCYRTEENICYDHNKNAHA